MANLAPDEYRAVLRTDLYSFIQRAFFELNPREKFVPNLYIELIAAVLEDCRNGWKNRVIINLPPRSLKSHAATVCFPAFLLGHNPSAQIICASYGQDLAEKHSLDCRTVMASKFYRELFPTRLHPDKRSLQEFLTTANGFRLATSVGGVLTGRGADFIIIDDPLKPEEALSDTQRAAVNNWFDHTLYSRLNDKQKGCIIVIMQRLHEDDLVGHLLEQRGWEILRLPAIAEEDECYEFRPLLGPRKFTRKAGDVLDPVREPRHVLEASRARMGSYNFAGQYQQSPAPLGGGMVQLAWFRPYVPGEQPAQFEFIFQSWDTGNKETELSDPSVCTTWGYKRNHLYLLDVLRRKLNYPDLKRAVKERAGRFRPRNILIEDKASGTQLIQDLKYEGMHHITRYEPKMDKVSRLNTVTSTIENGFVHVPTAAPWRDDYLHEMAAFPKGKHDDQVDSTSQALDWVKDHMTPSPLTLYHIRLVLESDQPRQRWMLDELDKLTDPDPPCPKCGKTGCAGSNRFRHCNSCGHDWSPPNPLDKIRNVEPEW